MQRLFSTFPAGPPGVGLLLLREALAGTFLLLAATSMASPERSSALSMLVAVLAGGGGAALLFGFLTPFAAAAGLTALCLGFLRSSPAVVLNRELAAVLVIIGVVCVALLGPGAFSLDARLFGRREITTEVPRSRYRKPP